LAVVEQLVALFRIDRFIIIVFFVLLFFTHFSLGRHVSLLEAVDESVVLLLLKHLLLDERVVLHLISVEIVHLLAVQVFLLDAVEYLIDLVALVLGHHVLLEEGSRPGGVGLSNRGPSVELDSLFFILVFIIVVVLLGKQPVVLRNDSSSEVVDLVISED